MPDEHPNASRRPCVSLGVGEVAGIFLINDIPQLERDAGRVGAPDGLVTEPARRFRPMTAEAARQGLRGRP